MWCRHLFLGAFTRLILVELRTVVQARLRGALGLSVKIDAVAALVGGFLVDAVVKTDPVRHFRKSHGAVEAGLVLALGLRNLVNPLLHLDGRGDALVLIARFAGGRLLDGHILARTELVILIL